MEDVQDFDAIAFDSVGNDVGVNEYFAGHGDSTGATAFRELFESLAAIPYTLGFGEHDFIVRIFCQVGSNAVKVLECARSPLNSSQPQRSAPTWQKHPLLQHPLRTRQHRLALRFHGFGQPAMSVLQGTAPMRWQQ